MIRKVIISIASSAILSIAIAIIHYTPMADRTANTYYFSFFELLFLYFIFSLPVFLIGGISSSYLIDRIMGIGNNNYFYKLGLYGIAGIVVGSAFLLITKGWDDAILSIFFLVCVAGALIFYHLLILSRNFSNV